MVNYVVAEVKEVDSKEYNIGLHYSIDLYHKPDLCFCA